jgi:hypothetical protein
MNKVRGFAGTAVLVMSFALPFQAHAQGAPVGHPYVADSSMMNMSGRHPLSAYDALKRLQAAGYNPAGPLTQEGLSWEVVPAGGATPVKVDMTSGAVSGIPGK